MVVRVTLLPASHLLLCSWGEPASPLPATRTTLTELRNPTIPMRNRTLLKSLLRRTTVPRLRRKKMTAARRRPTIMVATTQTPHLSPTSPIETLHLSCPSPALGEGTAIRQPQWPCIDLPFGATYKPPTPHPLEIWRETHLSTIAACPQAAPRLSRPHGDQGRPQGAGTAQSQGA